jgi:aminoglycoside phosphotransferase (APT) family kinase protein
VGGRAGGGRSRVSAVRAVPLAAGPRPRGRRRARSVRSVYRDAEQAATEVYERLRGRGERRMMTHHDVHIDNALAHRGKISLIDFDDCGLAFREEDLGRSIFQNRMRGCDERRVSAFRRGYQELAAWPDPADVEAFVAAAAMELANEVYQDFDPDYRAAARTYTARWARIAGAALRRLNRRPAAPAPRRAAGRSS